MKTTDKKRAGLSLIELVIAVSILVIATVPVYNVFVTATRINATTHKTSIAIFTAQLYIEECVGLKDTPAELQAKVPARGVMNANYNGYNLRAERFDAGYADLVGIRVTVYEGAVGSSNVLATQEDYIYVRPPSTP
jgi:Tfp pilus assembly protein PilE